MSAEKMGDCEGLGMAARMTSVSQGPPLPLPLPDARVVAVGVELVVDADGAGAVFVWGNAVWCWRAGDAAGRRLAAVQMVATGAASQREVAAALGVNETTVWRWRGEYGAGGVAALAERAKGPRRASKLTEAKVAEILAARGEGVSMQAVADRVGVSLNSVSRALRSRRAPAAGRADPAVSPDRLGGPAADVDADAADEEVVDEEVVEEVVAGDGDDAGVPSDAGELVALARPVPRTAERQAARAGALTGAEPVVTQGAGLGLAGVLVLLPALAGTGLLEVARQVYEPDPAARRASFYALEALLLTMVFAAAVGQPRAQGLTRVDLTDTPWVEWRLLGL